jgi:hypothetical protein
MVINLLILTFLIFNPKGNEFWGIVGTPWMVPTV